MKKIIAKKDFTSKIGTFVAGDEINNASFEQIVKLNEQGFIEPLSYKDLVLIKKELAKPKKENKNKEERL